MTLTIEQRKQLKDDLPLYAFNCLKIVSKAGGLVKLKLNQAQLYAHEMLETQLRETGKVRALVLKGRQQGLCYSPEMRVLTSDYRWIKIKDVSPGEKLFAVDEEHGPLNKHGKKTERRIREAVVEAKVSKLAPTYKIKLSNGVELIATAEHRHLCKRRGADEAIWREVGKTKPGDYLRAFCHAPIDKQQDYDDGWFGGLLDGEGSFGANPAIRIGVSQVAGPVLDKMKAYLKSRGIRHYELVDKRKAGEKSKLGNKIVHCLRIDRITDVLRLLAETTPQRFIRRNLFVGKKLPKTSDDFDAWVKVESITPHGTQEVIDLQTSEKTFICEGMVSHNSTYIAARFYHQITHKIGITAFVLSHRADTTDMLFNMTRRYHDNVPTNLKPETKQDSAKALYFDKLDSRYSIGTAGGKETGRGGTIHLLHLSESAFYENEEMHLAGLFQAVPSGKFSKGTEVILESTANGASGAFFDMWQESELGNSEYIAVFIPWFWQDEYREKVPVGLEFTDEEMELSVEYGLDREQIYWRRLKIKELGSAAKFCQEYPNNSMEAFTAIMANAFIPSNLVQAAMRKNLGPASQGGAVVMGVDPSGDGESGRDSDNFGIVVRQGQVVLEAISFKNLPWAEGVGKVLYYMQKYEPQKVFIDTIGLGYGVFGRLKELGYEGTVVKADARLPASIKPETYFKKRDEMWGMMREWFESGEVSIPENRQFAQELVTPMMEIDNTTGRVKLQSKKDMKISPGLADALALTFFEPVIPIGEYLHRNANRIKVEDDYNVFDW